MARKLPAILLLREPGRVLVIDEDDAHEMDCGSAESRSTLATYLRSTKRRSAILFLDSSLCFCLPVPLEANAPRSTKSLTYALEELLPFSAEEFTADFVIAGDEVLAVAALNQHLVELIEALEHAGIRIDLVLPATAAIAQHLVAKQDKNIDGMILQRNDGWDIVVVAGHKPRRWLSFAGGLDALALRTKLLWGEAGPQMLLVRPLAGDAATLPVPAAVVTEIADDDTTLLREASRFLNAEGRCSWINLRSGRLAVKDRYRKLARPIAALFVAVALFFGAAAVTMIRWTRHFESKTQQVYLEQQEVFRELFPKETPPAGVLARLESEHSKLAEAVVPHDDHAGYLTVFETLHEFLQRVPADMRIRLSEITIENRKLTVDGQARSQPDVDRLAHSLSQSKTLKIGLPRTRKSEKDHVIFSLLSDVSAPDMSKGGAR